MKYLDSSSFAYMHEFGLEATKSIYVALRK